MTNLFEVIYVSKRRNNLSDRQIIDEIVLPSGLKNRRLDITGVLWFSNTRFLQIIEGPRTAVESVFESILNDDRHLDIDSISKGPISNRSFTRWRMRALPGEQDRFIDELVEHYTPAQHRLEGATSSEAPESIIDQLRAYLIQLAAVEPSLET